MTKPSTQLIRSAALSVLAMAAFAFASPMIEATPADAATPAADVGLPSLTTFAR